MAVNPYRDLPSVEVLADRVTPELPRRLAVRVARLALDRARSEIAAGGRPDVDDIAREMALDLRRSAGSAVVNASGVLLHTNLGRAVWSADAAQRATDGATGFSNLELDLRTGERGRRGAYVTTLLTELTGAEDALVVNNNASALLLALAAVVGGKAVPVSRGELIEIGGSYRLPDVMDASGARLVEVGTTNRTRAGDYLTALQTHDCGAILKVHPSNYRVEGFHQEATLADLSGLRSPGTPLLFDQGSGLLDTSFAWIPEWLKGEPGARQSLEFGADLVLFSGDKLLGGPQAGIIVGRGELVARVRSHPLARALRVDGVTLTALAATLEAYLADTPDSIPFWAQALANFDDLAARCRALAERVDGVVETGASVVGAGSAPGRPIPSPVVRIAGGDGLFGPMLLLDRPVLARRDVGDLVIDLRAVAPEDDETVAAALLACL